jgi:hypothetical protein
MNRKVTIPRLIEQARNYACQKRRMPKRCNLSTGGEAEPSVVVSGDTSAVNSAQVIYLNTPWTLRWLRELYRFPTGLPLAEQGVVNAWLGGCNSSSESAELTACYKRADPGGARYPAVTMQIKQGTLDSPLLEPITARANGHIIWLPQRSLNAYPGLVDATRESAPTFPITKPVYWQSTDWDAATTSVLSAAGITDANIFNLKCSTRLYKVGYGMQTSLYRPGDFVVHAPGQSNRECTESIMLYYLAVASNQNVPNSHHSATLTNQLYPTPFFYSMYRHPQPCPS